MHKRPSYRVLVKVSPDVKNIAHYLEQAARLRTLAAQAQSPETRDSLMVLARGYERMAAYRGRRLAKQQ